MATNIEKGPPHFKGQWPLGPLIMRLMPLIRPLLDDTLHTDCYMYGIKNNTLVFVYTP